MGRYLAKSLICSNFNLQVVEQLNKRFQPSPLIIKKRIEVGFQYFCPF